MFQQQTIFPKIEGLHHIELYVGDARQAAHYYRTALGFDPLAFTGIETGAHDRASIVLQQGRVLVVFTSGLGPDSEVSNHVHLHGDGVKEIAFSVHNARQAYGATIQCGARPRFKLTQSCGDNAMIGRASVEGCGYLTHSFVESEPDGNAFFPSYCQLKASTQRSETGIIDIDHIAFGIESGRLHDWAKYYESVFGFQVSHRENVAADYSSMIPLALQNSSGTVKFRMMEPAGGPRRSQIEEYLNYNRGSGVQHIAFLSEDIFRTVRVLKANGVEFLPTPDSYYDLLEKRLGRVSEDLDRLREFGILVDCDNSGVLLQIFTKPLQSRPTYSIEITQRKGVTSFGGGNIRALFEAVEREQALRGNP